ncbi:hypothetical protein ACEPPN_006561 [Leptodophora sp. 'Broadleaf-Isolate-01']
MSLFRWAASYLVSSALNLRNKIACLNNLTQSIANRKTSAYTIDSAAEPQVVNPHYSTITTSSDPWSTTLLQSSLKPFDHGLATHQSSPRLKHLLGQLSQLDLDRKSPTLKSFTLFPKLPLELRLMIWAIVANENQRWVEISYQHGDLFTPCADLSGIERRSAQYSVPTIFHVSHESRTEALRYYTPCYDQWTRGYVYINFNADSLIIDQDCVATALERFDEIKGRYPRLPPVQSGSWTLDTTTLKKFRTVCLARRLDLYGRGFRWTRLNTDTSLRSIGRIFELFPSMEELTFAEQEKFVERRTLDRADGDEGYLWRELFLRDRRRTILEKYQRYIAEDPSLPACVLTSAVKGVIMTTGIFDDRFRFTDSLLLEEDLEPVGLVNGEYEDKTLRYTPNVAGVPPVTMFTPSIDYY